MENTTHLDYISAADGLRLYEVSVAHIEAQTKKRRVVGTHICGAASTQQAINLAHEELWVGPTKSSGDASDQQCRELERYLPCPAMTGAFVEGGSKLRWTMDRVP